MDTADMTDDENAMIVALQHGTEPRAGDPIAKALEARGLARLTEGGESWELTPDGKAYVPELTPG